MVPKCFVGVNSGQISQYSGLHRFPVLNTAPVFRCGLQFIEVQSNMLTLAIQLQHKTKDKKVVKHVPCKSSYQTRSSESDGRSDVTDRLRLPL